MSTSILVLAITAFALVLVGRWYLRKRYSKQSRPATLSQGSVCVWQMDREA